MAAAEFNSVFGHVCKEDRRLWTCHEALLDEAVSICGLENGRGQQNWAGPLMSLTASGIMASRMESGLEVRASGESAVLLCVSRLHCQKAGGGIELPLVLQQNGAF